MKQWGTIPRQRKIPHGGVPPEHPVRLVPAADPDIEKLPRGSAERIEAQRQAWLRHMSRLIAAPGSPNARKASEDPGQ
jgi:hypothetical protein